MIVVDQFDRHPMKPGERRVMILSGDGPFRISNRCFIDKPPPPGFRSCTACNNPVVVDAGESHYVVSEERFWTGKKGRIEVEIEDSVGESLTIKLAVEEIDKGAPTYMTAGA